MTTSYILNVKQVQKHLSIRKKNSVSLNWVRLRMQNGINKIWPTLQVWNFQQLMCQSRQVGMQREQKCMKVQKMWINEQQICPADVNRWGTWKEPQQHFLLCLRVQLHCVFSAEGLNVYTEPYILTSFKSGLHSCGLKQINCMSDDFMRQLQLSLPT